MNNFVKDKLNKGLEIFESLSKYFYTFNLHKITYHIWQCFDQFNFMLLRFTTSEKFYVSVNRKVPFVAEKFHSPPDLIV